jgi:large subunit ribosomal protein L21
MYAVIEDGGRQYRVEEGILLDVDYRPDRSEGDGVVFDRVLLYRTNEEIRVGQPLVDDVRVVAQVVMHLRAPKIYVGKFKRRKNYHRRQGHRQWMTRVRIRRIVSGPQVEELVAEALRESPEVLVGAAAGGSKEAPSSSSTT